MRWLLAALACLAIFHTPDGRELRVETQHISAVRPADSVQQQVAPGTKAIIYVGSQKFGLVETPAEIDMLVKDCITNGEPQ